MKTYDKYKSSGIDWIGNIPEHWEHQRIKFALETLESGSRETGGGSLLDGVFSIGGEHIGWFGELLLNNPKFIPESYFEKLNSGKIKKDDVLLVKDGATIGKCAVVKELPFEKCAVNEHVFILRANQEFNSNFIFYFIWSYVGQEQILLNIKGSAQPGLNSSFVNQVFISVPTLSEQTAIADYLDEKTAQIDSLINNKLRLIELLKEERTAIINQAVTRGINPHAKLKPSGIAWLGDIPEHWEVKRLKFVANVQSSNVDKKSFDNEISVLLCNYVDVYKNEFIDDSISFMEATATENEIEKFILNQGDVLITKDSETPDDIANPALVMKDFENVVCGYHLAQIKPDKNELIGEYLFRLFLSKQFNSHFEVSANGVTRYGLPLYAITSVFVPLPPIEEQKQIVEFIETATEKIDATIAKIEKEIGFLREYRTALISEVVTGKIKVI